MAAVLGAVGSASAHPRQLAEVKQSLSRFHHVSYAKKNGFGLVIDINGISYINDPTGTGNMGYHYANPDLVGDGKIDRLHPEAVLYEFRHGELELTAIEYILGHHFMLVKAPNRFGLPDFWMLHHWLWKDNPLGLDNSYNPPVHCP